MKKFLFLIIILHLFVLGKAQQTTQYTQYLFNHFAINPALAGIKECIDVKIGHRSQWVGFDGAPSTSFGSLSLRLKGKNRKHLRSFHGLGAYIESDALGPFGKTTINAAYAYHFPLSYKVTASVGVFAGIQQSRFDAGKVTLQNYNDNAISGSGATLIYPDISPGIWVYSDKFYTGLAIRQVIKNDIKNVGTSDTKQARHLLFTLGKKKDLGDGISHLPSLLLKWTPNTTPAVDLNYLIDYKNIFQLGVSYRNTDAVAAMFKLNFLKYFSLGYSFDFTTSKIRKASSNTHEIILGIYSCPISGTSSFSCPAFN